MKDRFSKLLLGEDMSKRGNRVCTTLAISNASTHLYVTDSVVELTPSFQQFSDGGTFEVMVTRTRSDLYINLPALKKLDAMLDGFHDSEFCYVDRGLVVSDHCRNIKQRHSNTSQSDSPLIQYEEK
ncbi:unnamed protein product [Lactuca virosa]|uniref:PRONE domain-containing protein n=1 Tax=Lactuca virosa TaxID=75947 RepID=A0AAU9MTF2_9ASTR|nr:unnamed protein product [Lactuca virosa]